MSDSIQVIRVMNLAIASIPAFLVVGMLYKWSLKYHNALYAISRMLAQLLLVGYFLVYVFESDSLWIVMTILAFMVFASSWIALRTIKARRLELYKKCLCSIGLGGGLTLALIT